MSLTVEIAAEGEHAAAVTVWRAANEARHPSPSPERIRRVDAKLRDPDALVLIARQQGTPVGMILAVSEPP